MTANKVRLYIRIRRPDGKDAFVDPSWNRNRTLRAGYAQLDGAACHHPEGVYYLRYLRQGKRVWEAVGVDGDVATVALRNKEHDLQSLALGRVVEAEPPSLPSAAAVAQGSVTLAKAKDTYLAEIRRSRSKKTISACEQMVGLFLSGSPEKAVSEITRADVLDHKFLLAQGGRGDRTVHNHIARITTFLKANGITGLLNHEDKPTYDEKEVSAYNLDEMAKLFAAASAKQRLLFEFFLATGFREQEVMYVTWANVNFSAKVISVRSKPKRGFRVKDKQERSVPVPDRLIAALAERKRHSTSMLVFPSGRGTPDGHMLRTLQAIAARAGLNCGECVTKGGQSCSDRPVCSCWGLHKFRKTFATMHANAGVSVPTIQGWLGHADLATTLRYLAVADLRSERTRSQVNASFASLEFGGAA